MAKVWLDGEVACEIDWDRERFNQTAIYAVGKSLFHSKVLWSGHRQENYAIALSAILGYPDYKAVQIGTAFGDLELKPRSKS